jgi:hypothetical protein
VLSQVTTRRTSPIGSSHSEACKKLLAGEKRVVCSFTQWGYAFALGIRPQAAYIYVAVVDHVDAGVLTPFVRKRWIGELARPTGSATQVTRPGGCGSSRARRR